MTDQEDPQSLRNPQSEHGSHLNKETNEEQKQGNLFNPTQS